MRGNGDEDVVIEGTGAVRIDAEALRRRLGGAAGRYRLLAAGGPVLLLQRTAAANAKRPRVLMAGEIVSRTTVMELVSFMAMNTWQGDLHVQGASGARWLQIAEGALKAAGSAVPSERMGEVMVHSGLITQDELARCVLDASPERRFGEIAVDKGFVRREQLFEALHTQVQRIFQNALLESDGEYAVLHHDDSDEAANVPALILHLPIQQLLMNSVQRIDEMALFRQRVPSGDVCPVLTPRGPSMSISESLRPVLALSDGDHSVLDMARQLHVDEYETTKRICQLMQIGVVEIKAQRKLDEAEALRMIGRFNQVLKKIFDTVARYGRKDEMHWTLDAWIRDTPLVRYFENCVRREGTIDAVLVVDKLSALAEAQPLEALHQALHELAGFTMLSAGGTLPRAAEQALSRVVSQQLANLRRA
jgi:hypothetical protein